MTFQPIDNNTPIERPILVYVPATKDRLPTQWGDEPFHVFLVVKTDDGDYYMEHDGDGSYFSWWGLVPTLWCECPMPEAA